ncbi:hypothetical protein FQP90_09670 [Paenarthrobacter nitroguajacolicus]|uniref:Uncharacterized protein n=1 Tax=Paenarthrobacter nitroguajacolicus TaxID=211146 RepID=A0A558H297_PAENT|nr:hypothetical protein [Paenarthrobacter nitroguajacolicus]TVU63250.1 hypothetical protein FQP90_09670 [Paenarthrobacter nitroguajacolicus]
MPDPAATAAGVAGLAGVTNLGKAAAEGSGPTTDESGTRESPADEPTGDEPVLDGSPARQEPHSSSPASGVAGTETNTAVVDSPDEGPSDTQPAATPGLTVAEPVIATPVVEEPVVDEPVVDTDAKLHAADAGDVDDWGAGSAAAVTADDVTRAEEAAEKDKAEDKAEWESSWTDESGAPVHHHEYTDAHAPTLPGAESAAAEDSGTAADTGPAGHLAVDHPYGTGSSSAAGDGYPVKASATDMTYHDEDSAGYGDVAADVWFESAAHAEAAGFRPPRRSRH